MTRQIELGNIPVDVVLKDIKNVHLSVYPPAGRVRISAPSRMKLDTIRVYAISKLDWIKRQQKKIQEQERETPREYVERESHLVWGKQYLLKLNVIKTRPWVEVKHGHLVMNVRAKSSKALKHELLDIWYRDQLKKEAKPLITRWEAQIGVKVNRLFIQRMKTKWGSCNFKKQTIRLNTDLARKPFQCLEYVVIHELVHILEPSHNARFVSLIERFVPQWKYFRDQLNRFPVRHEKWVY
ncbi:MAG TPA: SprT family zinc-dependent metalloprotease [bacterium]